MVSGRHTRSIRTASSCMCQLEFESEYIDGAETSPWLVIHLLLDDAYLGILEQLHLSLIDIPRRGCEIRARKPSPLPSILGSLCIQEAQ